MQATSERITKTPDVCGGDACVRGHRIPVWVLAGYRRSGMTDGEILHAYPSLSAADLEAAWIYAAANPGEIDRAIRENEEGEENRAAVVKSLLRFIEGKLDEPDEAGIASARVSGSH